MKKFHLQLTQVKTLWPKQELEVEFPDGSDQVNTGSHLGQSYHVGWNRYTEDIYLRCNKEKYLLKSDSKVAAPNRKIDAVSRPWIGLLSFRYRFEALVECDSILEVCGQSRSSFKPDFHSRLSPAKFSACSVVKRMGQDEKNIFRSVRIWSSDVSTSAKFSHSETNQTAFLSHVNISQIYKNFHKMAAPQLCQA